VLDGVVQKYSFTPLLGESIRRTYPMDWGGVASVWQRTPSDGHPRAVAADITAASAFPGPPGAWWNTNVVTAQ
jgi:hypothetical protein